MVQGCCWGGHKGKHAGKVSVVSLLSGKLHYLLVTAGTSQGDVFLPPHYTRSLNQ